MPVKSWTPEVTAPVPREVKAPGFTVLLVLLLLVVLSCTSLIVINYYTLTTMSAIRAFINGESAYSKAQKDGSRYLVLYLNQRNENYYTLYTSNLEIIVGDSLALKGVLGDENDKELISHLVQGQNDPADVDDMIWLVRNFKRVPFMAEVIRTWHRADHLIKLMHEKADSAHNHILLNDYSPSQAIADIREINRMDDRLTATETNFSDTLDQASRTVRVYLQLTDMIMVLLIVGCTGAYSAVMIRRLLRIARDMEVKNKYLIDTNLELDLFVYSASHDLRAPLTSLKGLVHIIREEDDLVQIREYLELMDTSLNQQDEFIREIINYSRNKRTELNNEKINILRILNNTINQHQFMGQFASIDFIVQTDLEEIFSDSLRLKIILNNLVSNAIRFSDDLKSYRYIIVRCSMDRNILRLEVEDNGIGVQADQQDRIFNMFFTTLHSKKGSGLGLYIARETATRLGGTVSLSSEPGIGCCFTVLIPLVSVPAAGD